MRKLHKKKQMMTKHQKISNSHQHDEADYSAKGEYERWLQKTED